MLPGGTDGLYRRVLAGPHEHYALLQVWSGLGVMLAEGFEFLPGTQVSATLGSQVSRTLTIQLPKSFYPVDPTDLFAPFGNEVRAFYGVRLGDGDTTYTWQVFRGRIQSATVDSASGTCAITCEDRARDVLDVGFVNPENSNAGDDINVEFARLVNGAVPDATFGTSTDFGTIVQPLTWQSDRGSALDELADAVGALWYCLASGDFVIRSYPWASATAPVLTLTDSQGGTVNSWSASRSRQRIFNVVTVSGERLNGDEPVFATAQDINPTSATFVGGNFGTRSYLSRLQTPSTQGGAAGVAGQLLRTTISPTEEWGLEVVPDGSLELGDTVRVQVDGRDVIQVVSSFALPLDLSGNMSVSLRSQVIGTVDEGGVL